MTQTYKHIGSGGYQQYDPNNLEGGRANPAYYTRVMEMKDALSTVEDGAFAVGHIEYDPKFVAYLLDFKKVLMTRDKEETYQSMKNFWAETTREGGPPHSKQHSNIANWGGDDVFPMDFHDLIDINTQKIDELQVYLFGEVRVDSAEAMQRALDAPSLTKAKARG